MAGAFHGGTAAIIPSDRRRCETWPTCTTVSFWIELATASLMLHDRHPPVFRRRGCARQRLRLGLVLVADTPIWSALSPRLSGAWKPSSGSVRGSGRSVADSECAEVRVIMSACALSLMNGGSLHAFHFIPPHTPVKINPVGPETIERKNEMNLHPTPGRAQMC